MIFLFFWTLFGLVGAIMGQRKGIALAGFLYGFFLGPFGCLIVALSRGGAKVCPKCGERVRPEAQVCRYCHADLSGVIAAESKLTTAGMLSRVFLYLVFPALVFVGLAFYSVWKSNHDLEQARQAATTLKPTPRPGDAPVESAPPSPAAPPPPTAPPAAFLADVGYSQKAALSKYPELGIKSSPLNNRFLARYREWKARRDQRLSSSDWPEKLAVDCVEHP